jgi:CubicO group peptidase (beta-lactamase class C family)
MAKSSLLTMLILACVVSASSQLYFPPNSGDDWEVMNPADLGWCAERIDSLLDFVGNSNTRGFIILKDGKIVLEKYYKGFQVTDNWYWASAGKTLTAFLVGVAAQENLLKLTDRSNKYLGNGFTSLSQEQEDQITVWHQLTMTSGLDDGGVDPHCTDADCLKYKASPGTRWAYHNAPYTLLDGVIASSTGMAINAFLASRVKTVTGMDGGYFKSGYNNVMASTTRSAARFGLLMLNNGTWKETQVLKDKEYLKQCVSTSQQLNKSYGYLWWLNGKESFMLPGLQLVFNGSLQPDAPSDMYSALGKNDQVINVVPSKNMVVVRFGDPVSPDGRELSINFNNDLWKYINALECVTSVSDTPAPYCSVRALAGGTELLVRCSQMNSNSNIELVNLTGESLCVVPVSERVSIQDLPHGIYALYVRGLKTHFHTFIR